MPSQSIQRLACAALAASLTIAATTAWGQGGLPAVDAFNIGQYYVTIGEQEQAEASFTEAIRLNPTLFRAYMARGKLFASRGDDAQAIADLSMAIQLQPEYAETYVERGLMFIYAGQLAEAIADFDRAIQLRPATPDAFFGRGKCKLKQGNAQAAIADFDEAVRLDPRHAMAYFERGNALALLGQAERARADHAEALRYDPRIAQLQTTLSTNSRVTGRPLDAPPADAEPFGLFPDTAPASSAAQSQALPQPPVAGLATTTAPPATEGLPSARRRAAPPFDRSGEGAESLPSAASTPEVAAAPQRTSPGATGSTVVGPPPADDPAGVIAATTRAIEANADDIEARLARAYALQQAGQTALALADLDQAVKLAPERGDVYYLRGQSHAAAGNWPQAVLDLGMACQLDPEEPAAHRARAMALLASRRPEDAVAACEAALALDPSDAKCLHIRSLAHAQLGGPESAQGDTTVARPLAAGVAHGLLLPGQAVSPSQSDRLPVVAATPSSEASTSLALRTPGPVASPAPAGSTGFSARPGPTSPSASGSLPVVSSPAVVSPSNNAPQFTLTPPSLATTAQAGPQLIVNPLVASTGPAPAVQGEPSVAAPLFSDRGATPEVAEGAAPAQPRDEPIAPGSGLAFRAGPPISSPVEASAPTTAATTASASSGSTTSRLSPESHQSPAVAEAARDRAMTAPAPQSAAVATTPRVGSRSGPAARPNEPMRLVLGAGREPPQLSSLGFAPVAEVPTAEALPAEVTPAEEQAAPTPVEPHAPRRLAAADAEAATTLDELDNEPPLGGPVVISDADVAGSMPPPGGAPVMASDNRPAVQIPTVTFDELVGRAREARLSGNVQQALAQLEMAERRFPGESAVYFERGEAQMTLGALDEAIASYTAALRLRPYDAESLAQRGVAHLYSGRAATALEDLTAALKQQPGRPEFLMLRARCYQQLGNPQQAVADLSAALRSNPTLTDAAQEREQLLRAMNSNTARRTPPRTIGNR